MKKLFFVFALSLLLTAGVSAQVSKPFNIYAGGGLSLVQGDWSDYFKTGYHGMGALGFNAAPMAQILGKVEYHTFAMDVDIVDLSANVIMIGADLKLQPTLPAFPFKPFGLAGGGFASSKIDSPIDQASYIVGVTELSDADRNTDFYFEIGGGAEFAAGPSMSFFAMVRYVSVQTEGESSNFIPITVGFRF